MVRVDAEPLLAAADVVDRHDGAVLGVDRARDERACSEEGVWGELWGCARVWCGALSEWRPLVPSRESASAVAPFEPDGSA